MINNNKEIDFTDIQKIINNKKLILVDFYATWCNPCKKLSPILDKVVKSENIELIKIDIDKYPTLTEKQNITSFPTLVLFKNGKEIARKIGFQNYEEIILFLKNYK
ncbi:thioredoxin [Texas Phoenix palm phytoplasma]|uniref:Thioredoxin n=1 Tax=Texas Phoenix palm phytoplasma TaxID=176709 RepID=A0ABS5BIF5_9MOLU|nr:thioredoxin [Texas Phoenix palm phytoplasma]MBP3059361.1 thioredoxin [Texas Phoenix palm phytoplasma]